MKYLVNTFIILSVVLLISCHIYASSKTQFKDLNQSNYTVMGLTIGECSRLDILSKLGPTLIINDEENADNDHLCYISERDETLILFGFEENQCTQFQMMSHKDQFYKWHFCAESPLVTESMSTESGITLGMHKDSLKKILGTPKKDSGEMLVFEYHVERDILRLGDRVFRLGDCQLELLSAFDPVIGLD